MKRMKLAPMFLSLVLALPPLAAQAQENVAETLPAGTYNIDRSHTSLLFRVSHLGFSMYTARFTQVEAELKIDPKTPEEASLTVDIDPASIETHFPMEEFDGLDFNGVLRGEQWLDVQTYPEMTYVSKKIERTGDSTAKVTGDLTLHGVTKPVTLDVTFNGGWPPNEWDPMGARIGFSATGTLSRSAFGVDYGVPEPGSNMGVGDEVEIIIETEFVTKVEGASEVKAAE
ncbi:YceI family protein [Tepidicaulis sp. LMO-SS28]|uniref:YceI family protein n=1 Tax=Tepidicaulis sp. LMO-SS28 TaxID=3447455 RepID=UPI003EE3AFA0